MNMTEPVHFMPAPTSMPRVPLRGEQRIDVPMAKHVSWRAGGRADRIYIPADLEDFAAFVQATPASEPLLVVGLGSNLLVRDGGFRGTVVLLHGVLSTVDLQPEADGGTATRVRFDAGVACPKVARFAAMHGLECAEFLAGIPGTMGGALAMNAGCYGSQTWDRVMVATMLTREGRLVECTSGDFDLGYRHVELRQPAAGGTSHVLGQDAWFVGATLQLDAGDAVRSRARIKDLLSRRIATQPLQQPNAGSVFRNPPGDHAARLIESCGLKGLSIGGAEVSLKHANFIVNRGGATASDIEALVEAVRQRVLQQAGVDLVPEVRIVGDA